MADIAIRPMVEEDIPGIMGIERSSFSTPWSEISFLSEVYKKNAFSNVAFFEENIIGYICVNYLLHESHILNLAVHERFGFRVESIRKKYYTNPDEDALLMMGRI